ncbi:leucine-rich repeat-containing protein 4C-like [Coccinella septempunctata]|uniref:leucine-rich repeat-containing protein 4C-like n=1 Tax=Coccinella septempunctata TaxID=41139 RepID=UPI001D064EF6|nr:leucine-rich repeat-containing protein 4C-like [Coccinella septempunctata]
MSALLNVILLIGLAYLLQDKYLNPADTEENPVDLLKIKHLHITNYTGTIDREVVKLFGNVETLSLTNNHIPYIKEDFFNSLKNMRKLYMSGNVIVEEELADITQCCKNLKIIELYNSGASVFTSAEWKKTGELPALEVLFMHGENIQELGSDLLANPNLRKVTIEFSKTLGPIADGAFNRVKQLEYLNLQGNKLKKVSKALLAPLRNLKELNLASNDLEEVTVEQLPQMPKLEKLNISHNPIRRVNLKGIKKIAPNLVEIDVSGLKEVDLPKIEGVRFVQ